MINLKLSLVFFGLMLCINQIGYAQDGATASHSITLTIPNVAMVDIEGGEAITLGLASPTEAGLGMGASNSNSSVWLNYSSTTNVSSTNSVMVKMDATLQGLDLKVLASPDVNAGLGSTGSPASLLTLSTTEQNLISNIGTCYTGDGINKGHNLTYSLVLNSYNLIEYKPTPSAITIIYTITNN